MKPGKPNTRRLTARGAAMRERIVSAAADLVWAQGAGETSLDDVMEKSGASKSQLYHYFADKDALLREAAALQTKRVLATHGQLLDSLDSFDALRRWRDAVLALNSQDAALWARSSTSCRRAPNAREQSSETGSRRGACRSRRDSSRCGIAASYRATPALPTSRSPS